VGGTIAMVPGVQYVEAEDVRRTPFRVALSPLPSLHIAVRDAVGVPRGGTPRAWREAIRTHLRGQDYETLAPFGTRGRTLVPDALLGLAEPPGESFKDGVERMLATPIDGLAGEIATCRTTTGNVAWRRAERDPERWLRRYVTSLLRAWKGFAPVWCQARGALQREAERVAMAAAADAQLELLGRLLVDGAVVDGSWRLSCNLHQGRARFPDGGLVLLPLVAGEPSSIITRTDDVVGLVGYPVRSVLELRPSELPEASLEALLGGPRAEILRRLASPTGIGRLAEALRSVPSAATHHVAALESAGLVERDRRGRQVFVRRTARGEALLQLYEESASAR
jgi:DNA-binding transcriptional ArsR family regulator